MRQLVTLAGVVCLILPLAACGGSSSSAKYTTTVTAVRHVGASKVGVAYQVKNVGDGDGTPTCSIVAGMSPNQGGATVMTLHKIGPGQHDDVAPTDAIVTVRGINAQAITADNGGVHVFCK
jgi:hypothetical protein